MSKHSKPCLFCDKPVRQFPSKRRNFCCYRHYELFIELSLTHAAARNELIKSIRRDKQLVNNP
jgi:hypothetical protein